MAIFKGILAPHILAFSSLCLTFRIDGFGAGTADSFLKCPTIVQEGTMLF